MKQYPKTWEPIWVESEPTLKSIKHGYAQKMSLYGLTKEQFLNLAEKQDYLCAICNASALDRPYQLAVDHDWETNEIRGLLCNSCNVALGHMNDDPSKLRNAADYLEKPKTGLYVKQTFV